MACDCNPDDLCFATNDEPTGDPSWSGNLTARNWTVVMGQTGGLPDCRIYDERGRLVHQSVTHKETAAALGFALQQLHERQS